MSVEDYPEGSVERYLLEHPEQMLVQLRKLEDSTWGHVRQLMEAETLIARLAEALTTPVTTNEKVDATSAARRFLARRMFEKGVRQAQIARTLGVTWMTVHRYVEGMPRRP